MQNGAGEHEVADKGTPSVAEAPIDHSESIEETYERLGLKFTELDDNDVPVEEPESEEEVEEEAETEEVTDWVTILRDAPQRINEVPTRDRANVIQQMLERERAATQSEAQRLQQAAYQRAQVEFQQRQEIEKAVAEIDELYRTDPEEYAAWEKRYPDRAAAYHRYKADRYIENVPPVEDYAAKAAQRLQGVQPEILAEMQARQNMEPGRYAPNADGLANLSADIAELKAKYSGDVVKRQEAARRRASVPKPDVTPGANPKGKLTEAALKMMSPEQIAALPIEDIEEAMASSR